MNTHLIPRCVLLFASAMSASLHANLGAATHENLQCIDSFLLPTYSNVARREPRGGTVKAVIKVRPDGVVESIRLESTSEALKVEVGIFLKGAKFKAGCNGDVELQFTYTMRESKPSFNPFTHVIFHGPNHFEFRTSPALPVVD